MDHIARQIIFDKVFGQLKNLLLGGIAPAGLVVAQSPKLRKRASAGEVGITFNHVSDGFTIDEVIVQFAVGGTDGLVFCRTIAHIKACFVMIVKKDTIDTVFAEGDEKRNGFVQCLKGRVFYMRIWVV